MLSLVVSVLFIWTIPGFFGALLIIRSEYPEGYWKEVTIDELIATIIHILKGPITLYRCFKWMCREEDLGDKKVSSIFSGTDNDGD